MSNFVRSLVRDIVQDSLTRVVERSFDSTTPIETLEQFEPGDVKINTISMISEDGERIMDITGYAKVINIYESLMSPALFCEIDMSDSINLIQSFPIVGEETVYIEFQTIDRDVVKYNFRINSIKNKVVSENFMSSTYTLELVSEDILFNSTILLSRKIRDICSDAVSKILNEELMTKVPIRRLEQSKGLQDLTITRLKPFQAIDMLRQRAVSATNDFSSYVFYRDRKGYNFVTLEKLIQDGSREVEGSDKNFFFDNVSQNTNKENVTFRNIVAYQQVGFVDTVSRITSGGLSNIVNKYDTITGKIESIPLDDKRPKQLDSGGKISSSSFFTDRYSRTPAVISTIAQSDSDDILRQEKQARMSSFIHRITENITQIYVYGDTSINIGDVITCTFIEASGMTQDKKISKDSGNYLVSKIRHVILNGDRPQHMMSMELLKDGFIDN